MSHLFLKIDTSVLLLQSIGIRFDFKILLKTFVNQVNPISLKHFQTSMCISSGPHAFLIFILFNASLTSTILILRV
ncbi:hypothetical protein Scep_005940 [Stephania cephalantha]|uniref:Uncharacterized protein n=1 Tax=Stephania cephalantha TaxID=152367 RepID=A0AAP0KV97_9MAGN